MRERSAGVGRVNAATWRGAHLGEKADGVGLADDLHPAHLSIIDSSIGVGQRKRQRELWISDETCMLAGWGAPSRGPTRVADATQQDGFLKNEDV
jgi:hypothetical protein